LLLLSQPSENVHLPIIFISSLKKKKLVFPIITGPHSGLTSKHTAVNHLRKTAPAVKVS